MLSDSAKILTTWTESNGLALNTKKTQAIVLGSSHALKLFKNLKIQRFQKFNSNGDTVSFFDQVSNLGVILDNTLS